MSYLEYSVLPSGLHQVFHTVNCILIFIPNALGTCCCIYMSKYFTGLTTEQQSYTDLAKKFAREEIAPKAAYHDRTGEVKFQYLRNIRYYII